jgi:glutamine cyclotransferase
MNYLLRILITCLLALLALPFICSCSPPAGGLIPTSSPVSPANTISPTVAPSDTVTAYTYRVVNSYPHDPDAFTQGLVFEDSVLYEGTGLYGNSTLRKVDLKIGAILQVHELPARFFGEGITIYGDKIIQLTWLSNVGYVHNKESFELLREFNYPTEGWGITHDGTHLIMSDGTSTLHFLDPESYKEVHRVKVLDSGSPVTALNELEYVQGIIYANVWRTDRIAMIAPSTGEVAGWIDLTGLLSEEDRTQRVDVLNGIAYDAEDDRLFVTGKWWPKLFEIELIPEEQS